MNFVTWSIRNPVPVIMMFIVLLVGGLISFPKLAVQDRPDIAFPFVSVSVSYSGTPPSQMETEITRKVEDAVSNIVGIEHINSTVSQGNSSTNIEFQFGTDLSQAMDDVRDAITRIRPDLPRDATEPYISRASTAGDPVLTFAVASDKLSATELSWFVDQNVIRALSGVEGVGNVSRIGGVDREVRVDLDPDRMAALGVTAGDVSRQLVRAAKHASARRNRACARWAPSTPCRNWPHCRSRLAMVATCGSTPLPKCATRLPRCARKCGSTARR
jgi:multidrug efflux pump subunit AcrB